MIEIKSLSRSFGNLKAVDEISFTINAGEIVGFLGPNGAGKTTTMRMMVGFLEPNKGSISLEGRSIFADPIATSARIGYLPEHNPLYQEMRVVEFLAYIADLRRMPKKIYAQRLEYVIQNCGLERVVNQRIGTLSKGFKQRVGLAQAILHDPDVLILDEPTSGLDPNQILEIRNLIRELGREKTVLLSSHIMQEVQALCDRVIIINKGRIVVDDLKENLNSYIGGSSHLILETDEKEPDVSPWLMLHPDVQQIDQIQHETGSKTRFLVPADLDLRLELSQFVTQQGWSILGLYIEKQSLEEIFHSLTMEENLPDMDEYYEPDTPFGTIDESTLTWEESKQSQEDTEQDAATEEETE